MITYKKYVNKIEYLWYDSSNLVFSACYDNDNGSKALKVVFKGGRTYLYRDVDVEDYMRFTRTSGSNGALFNTEIVKKYKGVRIADANLDEIEKLKDDVKTEDDKIDTALSQFDYMLEINDETGEFRLSMGGKPIYEGIEGQVSITNLLSSMHVTCAVKQLDGKLSTIEDFINKENIL